MKIETAIIVISMLTGVVLGFLLGLIIHVTLT